MDNLKMNRTVLTKSTFKEADDHTSFYFKKSALERLNYACAIINSIFQVDEKNKIDRTKTFARKHA